MPSSYIVLKGSIYHARYRIPKRLQWAFQKTELKFSLKTPNQDVAILIASAFKSHLNRVLQNLDFMLSQTNHEFSLTPLEQARIQNAIEQYIKNSIAEFQYLASVNQEEFLEVMALFEQEKQQASIFIQALKSGDFSAPEVLMLAQNFLESCPDRMRDCFGVPSKDYIYLARKLCNAQIQLLSKKKTVLQGGSSTLESESYNPINQIIINEAPNVAPPSSNNTLKLSEALPKFLAWKAHKKKTPTQSFIQEYEMQYGKFVEYFHDCAIDTLSRHDINGYIEHLSKSTTDKGKPYATETKNKYISKFRNVLGFIKQEELASVNFSLENLHFQQEKKAEAKREIFYHDEIKAFFSNDYYSGNKKFPYPSHYWMPLLVLFAGLRPSEIGQLYTSDIIQVDNDTWVILVMDEVVEDAQNRSEIKYELTSDKRLKTPNANRQVPIHPTLIKLGFLQYVEHLKSRDSILVFPNLIRNKKNGRSHNVVKWISGKKAYFGWRELQTLYSFRHSLLNTLLQAGCPPDISKFIAGHSNDTDYTHRTYTKQYDYQPLIEVIQAAKFDITPLPWSKLNYKYNVITAIRSANESLLNID